MGKRRGRSGGAREKPRTRESSGVGLVLNPGMWDTLCTTGYTRLSDNPEVLTAVNLIAGLVSSMTIHVMENTAGGDRRVKDELSRVLDIYPNRRMTRKALLSAVLRTLLLEGAGNAVVWPRTERGVLKELIPIPPAQVSFLSAPDFDYRICVSGVEHDPENLLHFVVNPDPNRPWFGLGYRAALRDVVQNLRQAADTKRGFLSDQWKPSVIIKVDGQSEELSSPSARSRFIETYLASAGAGEPWMIPAENFEVVQVKPLTLNDLAISDSVTLDKRTVAAILGVPPFVVGAGSYTREEWNHFISASVMPLVKGLEQELTRKLLLPGDRYISMNPWALYAYDLSDLERIGADLYVRGIMTGNEVREWMRLPPREGLDELVMLENYIPRDRAGDQLKLLQSGEGGET